MRHNAIITPINLKKNAFRMEIRKQWIGDYIKKRRLQFKEVVQIQNTKLENHKNNIELMLKQLPSSLHMLYDYLKQNHLFSSMIRHFIQMVDNLRQLKVNEYHTYLCILQSMIQQNRNNQQIVFYILKATITPLLHQAGKLIIDNKMISIIIISQLVKYLTFVQNRFDIVTQIQMDMISELFDELLSLLRYTKLDEYQQAYIAVLQVINNIIITTLPEQDKQNIKQTQLISLQQKKIKFLNKMFIESTNIKRITLSMMDIKKTYPISLYTLRVLVNFTHFANDLQYYHIMFDSQIVPMLGYLLSTVKKQVQHILIIRLINNLLVTNTQITQTKIKGIFLQTICKMFFKQPKNQSVSKQILSLFVNLVNFIGENKQCVSYLITNLRVCDIFLEGLTFSDLDNSLIQEIIIAFYPLIEVAPDEIKQKLIQNWGTFRQIQNRQEDLDLQEFIESLRLSLYKQEQLREEIYQNFRQTQLQTNNQTENQTNQIQHQI